MDKIKTKEELCAMRKQMFEEMEEKLCAGKSPEDSLFYYHPSEDRFALFWVMTQSLKGKIAKEKNVPYMTSVLTKLHANLPPLLL